MKYFKVNESGVTLIELLLALSLLTIILVTFMGFFTNAFQYNSKSAKKVTGMNIVREKEVDFKNSPGLKTFILNISDGITPSDLSKTTYTGLNLIEDITTIEEDDKPALFDGTAVIDQYYLLKLNHPNTSKLVFVYVKKTPDLETASIKLYRLYIELYDNNNNLLSSTYTYYEYD